MSDSWYALHVKPRFEKYVTGQLSVKGYETFMPSYVSKRKWSDRVKTLSLPLFPGYVFCRFDLHTRLYNFRHRDYSATLGRWLRTASRLCSSVWKGRRCPAQ